jgi:phosphatidylinositol alpha-mannosyltransferase
VTVFSMSPRPADALYGHRQLPRARSATIWRFALGLRQIDFRGFDALHCHGDDCLLAGVPRPRHVRTLHGASLAEARNCDSPAHTLRIALLAAGEYASLGTADLCVANARNTLRYFPSVRTFIPCGVDLETFRPGGEKSPRPSVLFVGGIQGKKRGWLMLKTFHEQIRAEIPDAELWVVSGEPVEGEGVRFFGKVDTSTLVGLYQSAWVFCMPSSYEGFGVPYVEAMACGTPAVATFNDGAREVLDGGKYGVLCDEAALGVRITELLQSVGARTHWAELGLQRARDYSWSRIVGQYLAAFRGDPPEVAA